jgi:predicted MFS family arabinose efflux permease
MNPLVPERWIMLFVLFLARTAMAYQFQTIGSLGPVLIDAFTIDFAWVGTLIGLYMLPGAFIAMPGGWFGQRFGAKTIVVTGLLLMAVGGALTGTDSLLLASTGRLISGVGAVLINVMMTKMVTDWFAGREIVTAMSVFVASWPLGLAMGLVSFPPLAVAYSWPVVMYVAALVALACLVLVAVVYRDPPGAHGESSATFRIAMTGREWLLASLAGLIWCTYNVGYIILISFLPELFTTRAYSLAEASRIVSLLGWLLIPALPLAGHLAERIARPNLLMAAGFGAVALAAAALPFVTTPAAMLALVSFAALAVGLPAGLIMALPSEALRPENRAVGMGLYFTFYYAGMALLPALAGAARDLSGSAAAPALFAAAMMGVALLALLGFRAAQRV